MVWMALLLAGCSDADNAAQDSAPPADTAVVEAADTRPKACQIITATDVASVTKVKVGEGVTTNDYMGVSQCRFDADTTQALMVSLHHEGNIENYRSVPGASEVDGIGDVAIWNQNTGQLAFRQGTAVVSISFLATPADPQWARALARTASAKLAP
jgi:hypothetical protein